MGNVGRRLLGAYQIAAAGAGVGTVYFALASTTAGSWRYLIAAIVAVTAVASLIAGMQTLEGNPRGARLSLMVQAFQVPVIVTAPISYKLFVGLDLSLTLGHMLNFHWNWGSGATLILMGRPSPAIGFNLTALAWILYLRRVTWRMEDEALRNVEAIE